MSLKEKFVTFLIIVELGIIGVLVAVIIWGVMRVTLPLRAAASGASAPLPAATQALLPFPSVTVGADVPNPGLEATPIGTAAFPAVPSPAPTPEASATAFILPAGPLTEAQRLTLYNASLHYIAPTTKDGIRLARELNYIGMDGHPSNVCGPLSIAILREAGLISPDTELHDFWLLNLRQGSSQKLLARTFPPERFEDLKIETSLKTMDWNTFPLQPGDFLYIHAGPGGNFDHMLVVNRVDNLGRAFSVTNYATRDGFVIDEVLLYDPNDPTVGMFHTWTKHYYDLLGATGFGGFELWRLRSP